MALCLGLTGVATGTSEPITEHKKARHKVWLSKFGSGGRI